MQHFQFKQHDIDTAIDALVEQGWYVWKNAIADDLCLALLHEIEQLDRQGEMQQAGIGRGEDHQLNQKVRRDAIHWLERASQPQGQFLDLMQQLQLELNRQLFLGLFEYEAHFALYSPGDFYKKHWDSFRGAANRMVTTVSYLNPDWQQDWGGELVMYNEQDTDIIGTVTPEMGTLVLFMSEQVPHEVRPTLQPRASIAGWFRRNTSIGGQLNPPS
jgi:SM-20-related protein